MTASSLAGAALLAISLGALWFAAVRLVSPAAPSGLARVLAAATTVAAACVIEALALAPLDLGTSPVALPLVSLGLAGLAALTLPRPDLAPREEAARLWSGADRVGRLIAGAICGFAAATLAFALVEPSFDLDSTFFHLPEVAIWIDSGSPGSLEPISRDFPIGAYPSTNEVLLSWAGGVSSNVGVVLLIPGLLVGLLVAGVVLTLRAFDCRRPETALAAAAVALVPIVSDAVTSLDSDLPATAWMAIAAGLCAQVARGKARPELLAFALVAAGMAIGTKTSTAPFALFALAAAWVAAPVKPRASWLAAGGVGAVAAGGFWYARNLVDHGNPLWPFVNLPVGDRIPAEVEALSTRFIERPLASLDGRIGDYLGELGASPLLLAGALVLPLLTRDRRLALGSLAVLVSCLIWSVAPATGEPLDEVGEALFTVTGVRYLMPTVLLATVLVGIVASRRGGIGLAARVLLAAAVAWGAIDLIAGRDGIPPLWVPLGGALIGGALAAAAGDWRTRWLAVTGAAATLAAALAVAAYPGWFGDRASDASAAENPLLDTRAVFGELTEWFEDQPEYRDGDGPVLISAPLLGPLAGGSFEHPIRLAAPGAGCDDLRADADGGWIVLIEPLPEDLGEAPACFGGETPAYEDLDEQGSGVRIYEVERG